MRIATTLSTLAFLIMSMDGASAFYPVMEQRSHSIQDGSSVLAPLAFVRFCNTYKSECSDAPSARTVRLNQSAWRTLRSVNRVVNRSIVPRSDSGRDEWQLGRRVGDCDDYAVEKRHRLIAAGYPAAALSLTEVVARGVGHLVLTVRTDDGDFVLDNLRGAILPWDSTGYRFVKIQSSQNPSYWVALDTAASSIIVADAE